MGQMRWGTFHELLFPAPFGRTHVISTSVLGLLAALLIWRLVSNWSRPATCKPVEACRRLGKSIGKQHIEKQINLKIPENGHTPGTSQWKVRNLWIYPVKSCRGIDVLKATCTSVGLEFDRQFSFARYQKSSKPNETDIYKWTFITQRSIPKMATIRTEIWIPDPKSPAYDLDHPNVQSQGVVRINFPDILTGKDKAIDVPFQPTEAYILGKGLEEANMTIWKDDPHALIVASTERNDPGMIDLQTHLQLTTPLALFRTIDPNARRLFRCAPRIEEVGYQPSICFQDAYPLHILNVASVRDIAGRFEGGERTLSAVNFRPNIVVAGGEAYAEDAWKYIRIGSSSYYASCRTVRCLLPNVNPITGDRKDEPNKTLKRLRKIDAGDPNNACLGMQLVPARSDKRQIQVGDPIEIRQTGEHHYIKQ